MLSRHASNLAALILARHIVLAQLADANARYDYLIAIHEAPYDRIRPSTDSEEEVARKFSEVMAELRLLPTLLDVVDERIARGWQRLERV